MWNEVRLFTTGTMDRAADGLAHMDDLGSAMAYATYPTGWTMAGNTPFRMTKGTTFEGGSRVPLIMRWPAHIPDAGGIRTQFHDVVDLLPTMLESAGVTPPPELAGRVQLPLSGVSMTYTWKGAAAPSRRTTQYVEIYGHRAIYDRGWKAVTFHPPDAPFAQDRWELYDLAHDINETRDLAAAQPAKLAELLAAWETAAKANDVYPLDDRRGAREMIIPQGSPQRGDHFVFYPPVSGVHKGAAPDLRGRSWTMEADVTLPAAVGTGVINAFGGRFAGYTCYVQAGHLKFHYNYAGLERTTVTSTDPLSSGEHRLGVQFQLTPAGGAEVVLAVDGREAGRGHVPRVMGNITHETFDLGCDLSTPVTEEYASPANFPGELRRVVIDATTAQP
jgi:hypothetical protein